MRTIETAPAIELKIAKTSCSRSVAVAPGMNSNVGFIDTLVYAMIHARASSSVEQKRFSY